MGMQEDAICRPCFLAENPEAGKHRDKLQVAMPPLGCWMVRQLSSWRKAGYASVESGVTAFELLLQVYLLEFYIRACGLDPLLASAGAVIAVAWDAVSDPLMGVVSDRTGSRRWGRRGGYILLGALLLGGSGIAMFNPPAQLLLEPGSNASQGALFVWYLLSYLLVNSSMTLVSVPHVALVGDFASESTERNRFFAWRLLFSNVGLLLGITLPTQLASGGDVMQGRSDAAVVLAGVLVLNSVICWCSIRTRDVYPIASGQGRATFGMQGLVESIRALFSVFQNRYFRNLVFAFCLAAIARALNSGFALFYYKDALGLNEERQVSLILIVFIVSIVIGIPLWLMLSRRFWKRRPALVGLTLLTILTFVTYPFFPYGSVAGPLVMAVLGGIAVGSILLLESLVLDTIDFDAAQRGQRRDGAHFGCLKMASKLARAAGIGLTGPLLFWVGYEAGAAVQSDQVAQRLRLVFGVGVGFFFLLAAIVFSQFGMTRAQHEQIKQRLAADAAGGSGAG